MAEVEEITDISPAIDIQDRDDATRVWPTKNGVSANASLSGPTQKPDPAPVCTLRTNRVKTASSAFSRIRARRTDKPVFASHQYRSSPWLYLRGLTRLG
jgi:hypothetical protein